LNSVKRTGFIARCQSDPVLVDTGSQVGVAITINVVMLFISHGGVRGGTHGYLSTQNFDGYVATHTSVYLIIY